VSLQIPTFKDILAATDYSPGADDALVHAAMLARLTGARLVVLHVLPAQPPGRDPSNLWGSGEDTRAKEKERLAAHVAGLVADAGLPHEIEVTWGNPAAAIVEFASGRKSDLIVIGAQGMSQRKDGLLGSVAERVIRAGPCSLLTVRRQEPAREKLRRLGPGSAAARASPRAEPTVEAVMRPAPITITQEETLAAAHALMVRHGVHQLPVVEDGTLIGIVAERDLHAHFGYLERTKVDAVMTRAPLTVMPTDSAQQAARILIEQNINALPVVHEDRLVGVVSRTDLLRVLVDLLGQRKGS
jgi:CBS domain-containing protein/nucleotide-binding universal stress UspA family protein